MNYTEVVDEWESKNPDTPWEELSVKERVEFAVSLSAASVVIRKPHQRLSPPSYESVRAWKAEHPSDNAEMTVIRVVAKTSPPGQGPFRWIIEIVVYPGHKFFHQVPGEGYAQKDSWPMVQKPQSIVFSYSYAGEPMSKTARYLFGAQAGDKLSYAKTKTDAQEVFNFAETLLWPQL